MTICKEEDFKGVYNRVLHSYVRSDGSPVCLVLCTVIADNGMGFVCYNTCFRVTVGNNVEWSKGYVSLSRAVEVFNEKCEQDSEEYT